jgi:microcystin-dependent protein
MWPSNVTTPNPTGKTFWLECLGQEIPKTNYNALSTLLGTTYGTTNNDAMFKLPNLSSGFIQGSGTAGNTGGSSSVPIAETNLPSHKHGLNAHAHPIGDHSHNMDHKHDQEETVENGQHSHTAKSQDGLTPAGFVTRLASYINGTYTVASGTVYGDTGYVIPHSLTNDGLADGLSDLGFGFPARGMQTHYSPELNDSPKHKHLLNFSTYNGSTGSPLNLATVTTGTNSGDTTNIGSGTPLVVTPPYITMRWFIRAL